MMWYFRYLFAVRVAETLLVFDHFQFIHMKENFKKHTIYFNIFFSNLSISIVYSP